MATKNNVIIFFCLATFSSSLLASSLSPSLIEKIQSLKEKQPTKELKVKEASVEHIEEVINSSEFKERQSAYANTILNKSALTSAQHAIPSHDGTNDLGDRVVLFLSSSMPTHVIRNYVADIQKINGVILFRGTVGGIDTMKPTLSMMQDILKKDSNCSGPDCPMYVANVSIDPQRFEHFNITKVPALVFEPNMKLQAYCEQQNTPVVPNTIVYGDSNLVGMLSALYQHTKDVRLQPAIRQLRGIK